MIGEMDMAGCIPMCICLGILLTAVVISKTIIFVFESRLFEVLMELYFRLIYEISEMFTEMWKEIGKVFVFLIILALLILPFVPVAILMDRIGVRF